MFTRLNELLTKQDVQWSSVNQLLDHLGTPCLSISVLEDGEIKHTSLGNQSCNEETLFQAASISKAITSLAVVKLAQEERLDLDIPISKYLSEEQLSWISTPATKHLVRMITIRHILTHTSGLAVHGFGGYSKNVPSVSEILQGAPPANNTRVCPVDIPGRVFSYSGGGFTVLQLILTTLLDKPFKEIMKELVLEPLQMTRSFFGPLPPGEKNYAPAYLTAHTPADNFFHVLPELAAAGLWTTPTDLLKAVSAVQTSSSTTESSTTHFLTKEWAKALLTSTETSPRFGLGWEVSKDLTAWGHGGMNDPGYQCQLLGYSNSRNGICIMTNSKEGLNSYSKIIWAISYLKGWPSALNYPYIEVAPLADRKTVVDGRWKEWRGQWGSWEVLGDEMPCVKWEGGIELPLLNAARTQKDEADRTCIELVVEGLEIVVRLAWKDGKRILEAGKSNELRTFDRSGEVK